jgi:hypothetical protein
MGERFEYNYSAPTSEERQEIESIRNQYLPKNEVEIKLETLKKLDNKVKNIPLVFGLTFGIVGTLMFGLGMTFFLEWVEYWYFGIPFSLLGLIMVSVTYYLYIKISNNLKDKYGKEIIKISNELLDEKDN